MAQLTEQQIEAAAKASYESYNGNWYPLIAEDKQARRNAVIAAAPHLQLPWDEPSEAEINAFLNFAPTSGLHRFIANRNASLQPKPDPRREAIRRAIEGSFGRQLTIEERIERILAALDGLK